MWRDPNKKDIAAQALRITAKDVMELGIADEVIAEPPGGAHHDYDAAADSLADVLEKHLVQLEKLPVKELLDARYNKFRNMAQYFRTEEVTA
jgi:acetyl-CoA carboxylase carboxyl transferase subunit alpha